MSCFTIKDGFVSYKGEEKIVNIPKEIDGQVVVGIADGGFEQSTVKIVRIPETVKEIGDRAFDGCTDLTEVELTEGLEKIGRWSFQGCSSLKQVIIPSTVSYIDGYAFDECISLEHIQFLGKTEHIGAYAFSETNIRAIRLPDGLKFIANSLFFNCTNLEYVEMPDTIEDILTMPFGGCLSLKTVVLPANLKQIYAQVFEGCSIHLLVMPNEVPELMENSFMNSEIRKVYAPYTGNQKIGILGMEHAHLLQMGMVNSVADYLEKFPDNKLEYRWLRDLIPTYEWNIMRGEGFAKYRDKTKKTFYDKYDWSIEAEKVKEQVQVVANDTTALLEQVNIALEDEPIFKFDEELEDEDIEFDDKVIDFKFEDDAIIEFEDDRLMQQQEEEKTEKDIYVETLMEGYHAKQRGQIDLAIEKYKDAITFKPYIDTAYYNLGKVLYIKREYEAAIRSYKTAISLGRDLYDALRHIGHALLDESMKDSFYNDVITFYRDGIYPYGRMQKVLEGTYQDTQLSPQLIEEYDRICIQTAERLMAMLGEETVENHS